MHKPVDMSKPAAPQTQSPRLPLSRFKVLDLTLARAGSGNPRGKSGDRTDARLQAIQQYLSGKPAPEFGTMAAHEFFLFESILSPRGATYRKVHRYPLT